LLAILISDVKMNGDFLFMDPYKMKTELEEADNEDKL
jgi:hypothetical protein